MRGWAWVVAGDFVGGGEAERAAGGAGEGVEGGRRRGQTRLQAAQIFRAAGRFEEMRRQAHRVIELVSTDQREVIREHVLRVLGPVSFPHLTLPTNLRV